LIFISFYISKQFEQKVKKKDYRLRLLGWLYNIGCIFQNTVLLQTDIQCLSACPSVSVCLWSVSLVFGRLVFYVLSFCLSVCVSLSLFVFLCLSVPVSVCLSVSLCVVYSPFIWLSPCCVFGQLACFSSTFAPFLF